MDEALVVGVYGIDLVEVENRGLRRKNRKSQSVKERDSRIDRFVVVEWGPTVDHALRRVGFLVGTSWVEDAHQVLHPYFAYRGRQHVLERRPGLARKQG